MRLGKRIIPVLLAACITSVTPLTSLALPAVSADAEETGVAAEDEVIKTQDNKEECDIKINSLTTAGTYYGIDGKFPIYAEYDATGVVYHSPYEGEEGPEANRQNLKLVITKEDGTEFIAEENFGSFEIKDCTGFENGQSYNLDFSVKYVPSGEGTDGITLYSVEKTVTFIEQESWALCNYLPTGEGAYYLDLYVHNTTVPDKDKDDDDDDSSKGYSVSNVSLIDKNGQAAACTNTKWGEYFSDNDEDKRYDNILRSSYSLKGMDIYHADCKVYCTRELEAGEELEAVYYIDGKMYKTGIKFTVTDKPYIKEADESSGYTADNICKVKVQAYNTDFNKLSLSLIDNETGKVLGSSVKFIQEYNNSAVYYVQCNNGKPANGSYNILYNYSGNGIDVISENAARYYYIHNDTYKDNIYSATCTWNYKTDSIEYYDANILSGSAISYEIRYYGGTVCTSGGGIIADNNHVAVIPLKKELEDGTLRQNTEVWYYVYITYADINGKINTSFSIFNPSYFPGYRHLSVCNPDLEHNWIRDCYYYMDKSPYLPDSKEFEFSIKFKCYNEDKLKDTCTATIYNKHVYDDDDDIDENKIGTVELSLKNENGSLSYNGTYKGSLNNKSMYYLYFNPYQGNIYFNDNIDIDGEDLNNISCYFNIADRSRMCLKSQHNYLASGEILMCFPSEEIADYYCGEDNLKIKDKLKVKILGLQGEEIGTYKSANNDFTITGKKFYRVINFSGSVKQKLANINYCEVYLYYGDGKEEDTIIADSEHPEESFYSTEYDSSNIYRPEYIKNSHRNSSFIALGNNENIAPNDYYYYDTSTGTGFTTVYGSESAFPATVTITGWYNDIETIKTITVPEPGYNFTESDLEGLSPDKKYNFFIKGADGSVNAYTNNYIIKSDKTESNKPGNNKPDNNKPDNNNPGGSTGIIIPYPQTPSATPETSGIPVTTAAPEVSGTPVTSAMPETSGTPQASTAPEASLAPQASTVPETSSTPQVSAIPETSNTPVTTAAPEGVENNIKKGAKVVDKKSGAVYKVTKTGKNKAVKYIESTKQASANITIPDSVKINGSVYKVTSVGKNAFKNNKKLKSVQIGKNITSIGAKAFYGCKKLRTIIVKTNKLKATNIGKNAFGNGFSSPQVKAAKNKLKLYKKIFQARGMSKKCKFKKL
ncbi:MAG: leucine-rich repeat protein [Lachnospiraceae bacterium]